MYTHHQLTDNAASTRQQQQQQQQQQRASFNSTRALAFALSIAPAARIIIFKVVPFAVFVGLCIHFSLIVLVDLFLFAGLGPSDRMTS